MLPLAFAAGRSEFTVSEVTEHLRTNVKTIRAFLAREIAVLEPEGLHEPGRVVVDCADVALGLPTAVRR